MADKQNTIRKMMERARQKTPAFQRFDSFATRFVEAIEKMSTDYFFQPVNTKDVKAELSAEMVLSSSEQEFVVAWQFDDPAGGAVIVAMDIRCALVAANWALERSILPEETENAEEGTEPSLAVVDRQIAFLFARAVATSLMEVIGDEQKPVSISASTFIEGDAIASTLAQSPRFGIGCTLKSDDDVEIGAVAAFGTLPDAASDEASAPDAESVKLWRDTLTHNIAHAPIPIQAIIASKTLNFHSLSCLEPGDVISFEGATIEEVCVKSALCEQGEPLVFSSLGSKDGARALHLHTTRID